jgi:type IV pilus assembly protein PilX
MKPSTSRTTRRSQKGAALVIGLIILVVLTLIGVQAMRTSIVQERMAGNMRERNVAFQAAEAALRVGEANGPFSPGNAALADPAAWDGSGSTGSIPSFDAGVAGPPVYQVGPPQYVRVGLTLPPEFRYIYPVTARGMGGQQTSVVVVQSAFEPMD